MTEGPVVQFKLGGATAAEISGALAPLLAEMQAVKTILDGADPATAAELHDEIDALTAAIEALPTSIRDAVASRLDALLTTAQARDPANPMRVSGPVTGPMTATEARDTANPQAVVAAMTSSQNVAITTSQINTTTTPTPLLASGTRTCKQVTVFSHGSVPLLIYQATGGTAGAWTWTGAVGVPLGAGMPPFTLFGVQDLGQIGIARDDTTASVITVKARWEN